MFAVSLEVVFVVIERDVVRVSPDLAGGKHWKRRMRFTGIINGIGHMCFVTDIMYCFEFIIEFQTTEFARDVIT